MINCKTWGGLTAEIIMTLDVEIGIKQTISNSNGYSRACSGFIVILSYHNYGTFNLSVEHDSPAVRVYTHNFQLNHFRNETFSYNPAPNFKKPKTLSNADLDANAKHEKYASNVTIGSL